MFLGHHLVDKTTLGWGSVVLRSLASASASASALGIGSQCLFPGMLVIVVFVKSGVDRFSKSISILILFLIGIGRLLFQCALEYSGNACGTSKRESFYGLA